MTNPDLTHTVATVAIGAAATREAALAIVFPAAHAPDITVLPSSLHRRDWLAAEVRRRLRDNGARSHLVIPGTPLAAFTRAGWMAVPITPPDQPPYDVTLPLQLVGDAPVWIATDADAVAGRGPFVLDLVARYLHPVWRVRHLAARNREDAAADLNLAVRPAMCIAAKCLPNTWLATATTDPIAGELIALALADLDFPRDRNMKGPWEERVVQRATELELGIQVPVQLRFDVSGEPSPATLGTIARLASHIGVTLP